MDGSGFPSTIILAIVEYCRVQHGTSNIYFFVFDQKSLSASFTIVISPVILSLPGIPCEDINECDLGQCKNEAGCENSIGDYFCNCTLGYDGKDCDIANCSYDQCLMNSTCRVEGTVWECDCLPFYEGENFSKY